MMGKTHEMIGGVAWLGILAALPALSHAGIGGIIGGWYIAGLAALGPDIDHPRATITRLLGPLTRGINKLLLMMGVKHRGMTHSLFATGMVALVFTACVLYGHLVPWVAIAAVVGWLSHSVIDAIGKQKVQFLWPAKGGFCLNLVSAGNAGENYFIFPLAILANLFLFWMVLF
jgi:membrane-bound metal-dependent hydrolase YbcI (DUF457 family)